MSIRLLRKVNGKLVEIVALDATLSHGIRRSAEITEYPVEEGSNVSDHKQNAPVAVTVDGFVSNNPVSLLSFGLVPQQDDTRSKSAYDALVETFDNDELVQVQSELEIFDDMMMRSLDVPRDRATANALQFTAEFQKVERVGTLVVEVATDVEKLAPPAQDVGKQTATESTEEESNQSSLLLQALQGIGVLE
jgi:hypothetical protein